MAPPLKVSVIIPAYQASAFVGGAVESVLNQTCRDFEIVVVNDGSPDTPELERVIAPYQGRIRYLAHPHNKGLAAARNTAIAAATGELLAFLDADDLWFPEFLEKQLDVFRRDPSIDMLWCDAVYFGQQSIAGRRYMELNPSVRPVTPLALLTARCVPYTSGTVVKRRVVTAVGGFDERFRRAEDYDLYLRLACAGYKLDFQPLVLGKRLVWPGSLSANCFEQGRAGIAVCEKLSATLPAADPLQPAIAGQIKAIERATTVDMARSYMETGAFAKAAAAYRVASAGRHQRVLALFIVVLERCPVLALHGWRLRRKLLGLLRMLRRLMPA